MSHPKRDIGIIGKAVLTEDEKRVLRYIGRCIARMGHRLVCVPAKGTADLLREGFESEGGEAVSLERGVLEQANHTLIYPDKRLLDRLLTQYPDLESRDDVAVIREDQLSEWASAVTQIMEERGIALPPR